MIPVVIGLVLGALLWRLPTGRLTWALAVTVSLASGYLAANVSGEIHGSWGFVLFDAAQTALAAIVVRLALTRFVRQAPPA
jgi:hypothetical protein